jgi:hypothetical protein
MKSLLNLALCCLFALNMKAQAPDLPSKPFRQATFEAAAMSGVQDQYFDPSTGVKRNYVETNLHFAALTNVSKYWKVGIQYNYLTTRFNGKSVDNYFIAGVLGRYDRPLGKRFRIYGDLTLSKGNYCTCVHDVRIVEMPFKEENLTYVGAGLGLAFKVYKPLWINIALNHHAIMDKTFDNYNVAQPTIGFQLHF